MKEGGNILKPNWTSLSCIISGKIKIECKCHILKPVLLFVIYIYLSIDRYYKI